MTSIAQRIIAALEESSNTTMVDDAMLDAAFLFEKARGLPPCGWSDEVVRSNLSQDEMRRLRDAVAVFVERNGIGSWTLGKCADPSLKPVLTAVLRRQLHGDASELFQALIALDNLGEPVFQGAASRSILDEQCIRAFAAHYLDRQ